jgi:hypothetical protein
MPEDFSKMKISELIEFAEEQAEKERQTPSLIEADSPERHASWAATLEVLRAMKKRGVPESLEDETA